MDTSNAALVKILDTVQQLSNAENEVVKSQRLEIETLRNELKLMKEKQYSSHCDDERRTSRDDNNDLHLRHAYNYYSSQNSNTSQEQQQRPRDEYDVVSSGSFSTTTTATQEEKGLNDQQQHHHPQLLVAVSNKSGKSSDSFVSTTDSEEHNPHLNDDSSSNNNDTDIVKSKIHNEIDTLRHQVSLLVQERTALIQEVQVHQHTKDLSDELQHAHTQISMLQTQVSTLQSQLTSQEGMKRELERTYQLRIDEMEKEMGVLIRDKLKLMESQQQVMYDDGVMVNHSHTLSTQPSSSVASSSTCHDEPTATNSNSSDSSSDSTTTNVQRLKHEISRIKAENQSLRDTARKDIETIASLEEDIKCLSYENLVMKNSVFEDHREFGGSSSIIKCKKQRKRVAGWSQGSVGGDNQDVACDTYKRSIDYYEPSRERLGSAGTMNSGDAGSNSLGHESDNVSVLFGQDSINRSVSNRSVDSLMNEGIIADDASDHKSIRAHAERMLYWANKAAERSKSPSTNSVASGSYNNTTNNGGRPSIYRHASVPTTIGLPPRGGSSKKRSSNSPLPPRPPSDGASIGNATNKSDKENGGSSFNVAAGAASSSKRNNGDKAVIFNLDKVQSMDMCCQCSTSPFSGNDAHSEFYLPKLGLACACGGGQYSQVHERDSFAKNPTSLSNILREWQCDFLASLGLHTADQLLRAHKTRANDMSRKMRQWREDNNLPLARSKECYVALMVWTRTAKVVLRSIQKQRENGAGPIEKPGFLDIACSDAYTVGSVSTLGQMSSVDGRVHEMMEI